MLNSFSCHTLSGLSIIVPAYNPGNHLRECIQSIEREIALAHPFLSSYEILIVDDGSDQPLDPYIRGITKNISLIINQRNLGRGAARNIGLKHAQFEILSFIDADDLCAPGRFERMLMPFRLSAGVDCVNGMTRAFFDNQSIHDISSTNLINGIIPGSFALTRKAMEIVGPFDSQLKTCEFAEWYSRFVDSNLNCIHLNEEVLLRRQHLRNSSVANAKEYWDSVFSVLRSRLQSVRS